MKLSKVTTNSDDKGDDNDDDNCRKVENQQVKQGEIELLNALTSKLVFHMAPMGEYVSKMAINIFQIQNLIGTSLFTDIVLRTTCQRCIIDCLVVR